jgi:hypothetical protein
MFSNRNACGTTTLKPVWNHSSAPRWPDGQATFRPDGYNWGAPID